MAPAVAHASTDSSPVASDMQVYRLALQTYDHERQVINRAYHLAWVHDRATELRKLHSAKSAARKSIIRAAYREAIVEATAVWQSALADLGSAPEPPLGDHIR